MTEWVTIDRDFSHSAGGGYIASITPAFFFIKKSDLDAADGERVMWDSSTVFNGFLDTAETIEVVSDNVNDTSAGSGAQSLLITGILPSGSESTEVLTLNGTTIVETVNQYSFVRSLRVFNAGTTILTNLSANGNTGLITATAKTSGNLMNTISPTSGISSLGAFVIPKGYRQYITKLQANITKTGGGSNPLIKLRIRVSVGPGQPFIPFFEAENDSAVSSGVTLETPNTPPIPAGSKWVLTLQTDTNNTSITGTGITLLEKI